MLWQCYQDIKQEAERLRFEHGVKEQAGIEVEPYPMHKYEKETGWELDSLK